ncbi:Ig-like domain-containing protein [Candidatus Palauibacter sp.]|uniref:Ig-like domain-containing protein n=1 Tax=Candidatus Palauibacter sp. TaxID=3101350 RepID=UPI003B017BDF
MEQVVAEVIVTPPAPTVFEGDTLRLAAEARDANEHQVPEVAFAWISDDEAVATVDSTGLVRAVTRGTATITARTGDTDGDGDRDLVILRTGDGTSRGFYEGYYVQLLEQAGDRRFTDATAASIAGNEDGAAPSVRWLRIYDVDDDGDLDIVADDYSTYGLAWRNDGAGRFRR